MLTFKKVEAKKIFIIVLKTTLKKLFDYQNIYRLIFIFIN